tara:strand:- start:288 stop:695 length:408 start_codon:yes stop_codon:yes gene_type:complete
MKKTLVLCTGNSCRSQMAEGFLKQLGCSVRSAGTESHGINRFAVKVMGELNIDISKNLSKKIDVFNLNDFDLIFTVCDHVKQTCPIISTVKMQVHQSFIDPTLAKGTENEKLRVYRIVRNEIKLFCDQLFNQYYG